MPLLINGRTAVHKQSSGKVTATEQCYDFQGNVRTYINTAYSKHAENSANHVLIVKDGNRCPLCTINSYFSKSTGDEDSAGGVKSGTTCGKAEFVTASANVLIDQQPATRQGDHMVSNHRNTQTAPLEQPGLDASQHNIKSSSSPPMTSSNLDVLHYDIGHFKGRGLLGQLVTQHRLSTCHQTVPIGRQGEHNQLVRRLTISNLKPGSYDLQLKIPNQDGSTFLLPLGKQLNTMKASEPPPPLGKAEHIILPVQLRWRTDNNDQPLAPSPGDLSDIARLPDWIRSNVWEDLAKHYHQLTQQPWPKLLRPTLQHTVQQFLQPQQALPLRQGWLYIFKNGYYWRELQIVDSDQFSDVNLANEAGFDSRQASGQCSNMISLPCKINQQENKFELAYSSVQWSWDRINHFGGIDPADPRLIECQHAVTMPNSQQQQNARAARAERMEVIHLQPFIQNHAKIYQTNSQNRHGVINARLLSKDHVPTILLPDPIGIAERIQKDIVRSQHKLMQLMQQAKQHSHFYSALITYQVFFNSNNTTKQQYPSLFTAMMTEAENSDIQPNIFLKSQQYLNKTLLEDILQTQSRKQLRSIICIQQRTLITLIQDPNLPAVTTAPTSLTQQNRQFNHSLTDFFALPLYMDLENNNIQHYWKFDAAQYSQAFRYIDNVISLTSTNPALIDNWLDAKPGKIKKTLTPGQHYVLSLSNPKHCLHNKLFPSAQQRQSFQNTISADSTNTATTAQSTITGNGCGQFNLTAYRAVFYAADTALSPKLPASVNHLLGLARSIIEITSQIWRNDPLTLNDKADSLIEHVLQWLKLTGDPVISQFTLAEAHHIKDGQNILGIDKYQLNKGINKINTRSMQPSVQPNLRDKKANDFKKLIGEGKKLTQEYQTWLDQRPIKVSHIWLTDNKEITPSTTKNHFTISPYGHKAFAGIAFHEQRDSQQIKKSLYHYARISAGKFVIADTSLIQEPTDTLSAILTSLQLYNLTKIGQSLFNKAQPFTQAVSARLIQDSFCLIFIIHELTLKLAEYNLQDLTTLYHYWEIVKQTTDFFDMLPLYHSSLTALNAANSLLSIKDCIMSWQKGSNSDLLSHALTRLDGLGTVLNTDKHAKYYHERKYDNQSKQSIWSICSTLSPFSEFNLIALGVFFSGQFITNLFKRDEVIEWCQYCYFSIITPNTTSTDFDTVNSLIKILFTPHVCITQTPYKTPNYSLVKATIALPHFTPEHDQIITRMQHNWNTNIVQHNNTQQQNDIKPQVIEQIIDSQNGRIVALRYYYPYIFVPTLVTSKQQSTFLAKTQLVFNKDEFPLSPTFTKLIS